ESTLDRFDPHSAVSPRPDPDRTNSPSTSGPGNRPNRLGLSMRRAGRTGSRTPKILIFCQYVGVIVWCPRIRAVRASETYGANVAGRHWPIRMNTSLHDQTFGTRS